MTLKWYIGLSTNEENFRLSFYFYFNSIVFASGLNKNKNRVFFIVAIEIKT